ncbi:alpha/beta fold hydrolase [Paenibacillus timonensis]|uniref:alpha/beta fold hydrolase n=1 Tax=Paenibacillus timonensis TaxID=225915 RepID=UPI003F943DC2
MKTRKRFKFWKVVRNIFLAILTAGVVWFMSNLVMTKYEHHKYLALGEFVEVEGKHMHVYTKGEGENTIVLLSGLGTPAPALDFEPLINELSKTNKVVVVEAFGYGWSEIIDKERTVENIVEETRAALQQSNIKGPYILMPHSISGIYSLYYANRYPDEVKAIIGIDSTLPQMMEYFGESAYPAMPNYMSYLAPSGIARLMVYFEPNQVMPHAVKGTYTEENLRMTKAISAWKTYNKNVVAEMNELKNNVDKTRTMKFPADLPVMIFTPKEDNLFGKSKISFYQTQLQHVNMNQLVVLEGEHYLHWTQYKEMSKYVNGFIETMPGTVH